MPEIRPAMFRFREIEMVDEVGDIRRVLAMLPHDRFVELCRRQYQVDDDYALTLYEKAGIGAHRHTMVEFQNAWENLPIEWTMTYPTMDHLRKRCCVLSGWAHHSQTVLDTPSDAKKYAAALRKRDDFAVVRVKENVVDEWTPKSMSPKAFPTKKDYQEAKRVWLDALTVVMAVARGELDRAEAQRAMPRYQLAPPEKKNAGAKDAGAAGRPLQLEGPKPGPARSISERARVDGPQDGQGGGRGDPAAPDLPAEEDRRVAGGARGRRRDP